MQGRFLYAPDAWYTTDTCTGPLPDSNTDGRINDEHCDHRLLARYISNSSFMPS
jgi:hypothetical protein